MSDARSQVFVIGGGINALGVVRSLKSKDFQVICVASSADDYACLSRYVHDLVITNTQLPSIADRMIELGQASVGVRKPFLVVTEEHTVSHLAVVQANLSEYFTHGIPSLETAIALQDKTRFDGLAKQWHLPVPRTIKLAEDGALRACEALSFPVVLKPCYHHVKYQAKYRKAYKVETYQRLCELVSEISPTFPDLMVQEWIEGNDADIYFLLLAIGQQGEFISPFVGRKLCSWPPMVGGTAACVPAMEYCQELLDLSREFIASSGVRGIFGIEFKRDRRSNTFYAIEPTVGRTDYQHEIATLSGYNMIADWIKDTAAMAQTQRQVVWQDSLAVANAKAKGSEIEYPKGSTIYDALFRVDDPMPWLHFKWTMFKQKFGIRKG